MIALEFGDDPIHDSQVEVVPSKMSVAVGGAHFEDSVANLKDRDVEGSAAQVVNCDGFLILLVETIRQRRRGRFVDDAQDFQAGDASGILRRVPLAIVEVRRHGDDGLRNLFAKLGFCVLLELL